MTQHVFIPDRLDRASIAHGWDVFASLLTEIARLIAGLFVIVGVRRNEVNARLRLCESLVRRLLIIEAMRTPLPVIKPLTAAQTARLQALTPRRIYEPCDVRYRPPPPPVYALALSEPLNFGGQVPKRSRMRRDLTPRHRETRFGILTVRIVSTAGIEPAQDKPSPSHVMQRILALKDIAERPEHHIRRMARWVARRRAATSGRRDPRRPGSPPGAHGSDKYDDWQDTLTLTHIISEHALYGPPPDKCNYSV